MSLIKLSGTLPKDDTGNNGLDTLHREVVQRPNVTQFVVGAVAATKTVTDHKRGNAKLPEVEFLNIEGVLSGPDRDELERILGRARKRRLGENPDQLDVEDIEV